MGVGRWTVMVAGKSLRAQVNNGAFEVMMNRVSERKWELL